MLRAGQPLGMRWRMDDDTRPTDDDMARDLSADLAACNAATGGPWEVSRSSPADWSVYHVEVEINIAARRIVGPNRDLVGLPERDARFIAAAREGWPAALRRALAAEALLREVAAWLPASHAADRIQDYLKRGE